MGVTKVPLKPSKAADIWKQSAFIPSLYRTYYEQALSHSPVVVSVAEEESEGEMSDTDNRWQMCLTTTVDVDEHDAPVNKKSCNDVQSTRLAITESMSRLSLESSSLTHRGKKSNMHQKEVTKQHLSLAKHEQSSSSRRSVRRRLGYFHPVSLPQQPVRHMLQKILLSHSLKSKVLPVDDLVKLFCHEWCVLFSGRGVFATSDIFDGQFVAQYAGSLISMQEGSERENSD